MSGGPSASAMVNPAQQGMNQSLSNNYTDPVTNEANVMSLMTLKAAFKGHKEELKINKILNNAIAEESRHLLHSLSILTGPLTDAKTDSHKQGMQKLREKYGRDLKGAINLSNTLKAMSDKREIEMWLDPHINDAIRTKETDRLIRGGFTLDGQNKLPGASALNPIDLTQTTA